MNAEWAVRFDDDERRFVGAWRLQAGVEACEADGALWLRGPDSEACRAQLERFPIGQRYRICPDLQLVPQGALVPRGYLPRGQWQALHSWLELELPTAALAGKFRQQVSLKLVRDNHERTPNLLVATGQDWIRFASSAAHVRLARLRFAMSEGGRIAVAGTPLPAMPGAHYCEQSGIAAPAGWTWSPHVAADVLGEGLCLKPGDIALLSHEGWQFLGAESFVQASRAAARATLGYNHA
jgi:hypothetical protein